VIAPSIREDDCPYLSLVVTARNDDHGGNLLGRMQTFVNGWIAQARRYSLSSELIVVEWNPPEERKRLREVLKWPQDLGPCRVRFLEVPPDLHKLYRHADALPLYQMIAKNVGIRRARGRFILATNIDILFSDELMAFLAARRLELGRMYRIDRHDVMSEVPVDGPLDEQLEYCRTHLLRMNTREGTFSLTPDGRRTLSARDIAAPDSGVWLVRGWYPPEFTAEGEVFRWIDDDTDLAIALKPESSAITLKLDLEPGPGMGHRPMSFQVLDGSQTILNVKIECRTLLQVRLRSDREKHSLRLRIRGGGSLVPHDPRALNCRVFSCGVVDSQQQSATASKGESVAITPLKRDSGSKSIFRFWERIQGVIRRVAEERPFVTITLPVSPIIRRGAAFYVRKGGITGMLGISLPAPHVSTSPDLQTPRAEPLTYLHTNACGDFTLAAREHWFDLRGYPEFDEFSMNIDSVFCYALHHGGAREEVLPEPMRIYHIEHGTGSGWTPEGQAALFERIAAKGLTFVSYQEVMGWAAQMRRFNSPMIFNREDWGLAKFELQEYRPQPTCFGDPAQPDVRCVESA